jgi:tRNA-dihydrouridine synthase
MERDADLACRILTLVRRSVPHDVSVSAKIRLPLAAHDDAALKERVRRLLDTGINFLTIHGRTLVENKTKVSACHLDRIRLAVEEAERHRPGFMVVANGGVEVLPDVARVRDVTGAVAVMSSEALLECPNVFMIDTSRLAPRRRLEQQFGFARDYLTWCRAFPPLPGVLGHTGGSFNVARGHLFKFLHRYLQEHPDLRDQLGSNQLRALWQVTDLIDRLYERYDGLTDDDLSRLGSGHAASSWYRRHWHANTSLRVHQRHSATIPPIDSGCVTHEVSLEQRKTAMRKRIARLQEGKRRKLERAQQNP